MAAARVFESMGVYAPTLGIIGAVLGLMTVMQNLEDPRLLGQGIAAAFTATVYGIGFANLLFLPTAGKLRSLIQLETRRRIMIIDGLAAVAQGENPRVLEARLQGYLST
jgi:chemotaxis protein MotA